MGKKLKLNVSGQEIQRLRIEKKNSQEAFAGHCQRLGLNISRSTFAHIENGTRCAKDYELSIFSKILKVNISDLILEPHKWTGIKDYTHPSNCKSR